MNVVFFGDSICFGQFVSPDKGWITRISNELSKLNGEVVVSNPSISGNTTRMALSRMAYDVQAHGIDILYIQYGINDSNYWDTDFGLPRVSPDCFEANLKEIIWRGRVSGAKKILINTNHPTAKEIIVDGKTVPHQDGNERYNEIARKVANETAGAQLIDMEKVFLDVISNGTPLSELLLPDGIHLSQKGHDLYFKEICPIVMNAVKDLMEN